MKPLPVTAYAILLGLSSLAPHALPEARADETNRIRTITRRGERVDLEGFLVTGKHTLFEFYADWSPACEKMGPKIEAQIKGSDEVVLRRINVRSWGSPVVSQHQITAIPHYKLYDSDGKLIREFSPANADTPGSGFGPRERDRSKSRPRRSTSPSSAPAPHAAKVLNICPRGEIVDLKNHLVKGRYTLFEYYADW